MSFTDQKPWVATEKDCSAKWGCRPTGERFRCYLCGTRFVVGDTVRWVYANGRTANGYGLLNFLVCDECDGPDVLDMWVKMNEERAELERRYWWASHPET